MVFDESPRDAGTSPRQPHVLLLTYTFQPEPGVVRGLPLAKALQARGYRVSVLTGFPQYPLGRVYDGYTMRWRRWETLEGVPVLRVPMFPSHDQSASRRILTYLSFMVTAVAVGLPLMGRVDLVYHADNLPSTGTVAWIASRFSGGVTVQHIADLWPDSVLHSGMLRGRVKAIVGGVLDRWCNFVYRRNAAITVLSPGFRKTLISRGVPAEKVHVIYNWAADEEQFFPVERDVAMRDELGFTGKFVFLYAGNLGPLQSLETIIEAAAQVRDLSHVEIAFMGTGPAEAGLRAKVAELGAMNVRFLERRPVEQMNAINAQGDVLLVSLRDLEMMRGTVPSKTQVAMASARPILMAVAGDAADLVERSGAGIAVPPGQAAPLAAAMRRLAMMSPEELREMGARGRRFYDEHLSLSVGAEQTDSVFREVLRMPQPVPASIPL
jgi:colanic acid biosynthesis glycosyl transferase WcaI